MKLKQVAVAGALAAAASVALADSPFTTGLSFVGGTAGFSRTPTIGGTLGASFMDTYNFTLTGMSYLTFGSVTTSEVPIAGLDLDFTSVVLTGPGGPYSFAFSSAGSAETYRLDPVTLVPGSYALVLAGLQDGPAAGSYGGQINVVTVPVPEPEMYTLLMAGLGAIGFVARRRKTK